jgi:hypothetical protein
MFIRNCPICNKEIQYSTIQSKIQAELKSSKCKVCAKTGVIKIANRYFRTCKICKNNIKYASKYSRNLAELKDAKCKVCTAKIQSSNFYKDVKSGIKTQPFLGKAHKEESIKKISNRVKEAYADGRLNSSGKNNPMFGKTVHDYPFLKLSMYQKWVDKYGKTVADNKLRIFKANLSNKMSGSRNPMFGKPSPTGSGNGWSGWYNGFYFRSLMELSFLVYYIPKINLICVSGETIRIPYIDINGNNRTYLPDFMVGNYLIEIKPKKLHTSKAVSIKTDAAKTYCKQNGLIFKMIEPVKQIGYSELRQLVELGKIKLIDRYLIKLGKI